MQLAHATPSVARTSALQRMLDGRGDLWLRVSVRTYPDAVAGTGQPGTPGSYFFLRQHFSDRFCYRPDRGERIVDRVARLPLDAPVLCRWILPGLARRYVPTFHSMGTAHHLLAPGLS